MNLEKINAELSKVTLLRQLRLSLSPDPYLPDPEFRYDLELELFETGTRDHVHLVFRAIGEFRVLQWSVGVLQFCMLKVEPNHPGHEQRYRIRDLEDDIIAFTCQKVELL